MTVPTCKTHNVPMRASDRKPGSFYCTRKMPDGSYCRERWDEQAHPAADGTAIPPPGSAMQASNQAAIAALSFAGSVYHGTGRGDDALSFAKAAFRQIIGGE